MNVLWEFWAIDQDGKKHHEFFKKKFTRESKATRHIKDFYGVDKELCIDFGIRKTYN